MAKAKGMGFDLVERFIEREDVNGIGADLQKSYVTAKALLEKSDDRTRTKQLKRIIQALEQTAELLCYLLNVKFELTAQAKAASGKKK